MFYFSWVSKDLFVISQFSKIYAQTHSIQSVDAIGCHGCLASFFLEEGPNKGSPGSIFINETRVFLHHDHLFC
jgi:hypothetical protein